MTFRLMITGSRTWPDPRTVRGILATYLGAHGDDLTVVHGACPTGADAHADAWCLDYGIEPVRFRADWDTCVPGCPSPRGHRVRKRAGDTAHPGLLDTYCPDAGPRRNRAMVAAGADVCHAFWMRGAYGTTSTVRLAKAAGIPVRLHVLTSEGVAA